MRKEQPPDGDNQHGNANLPIQGDRRRWPRQSMNSGEAGLPSLPALQPLQFSTRQLDLKDQFAAWKTYLAPVTDVKMPDDVLEESGFAADHTAWNLGGMIVVQRNVPAHSYSRSSTKIRSNSIDHWHVVSLRSGKSWTEVDGRIAEGGPGKLEIRSLGHPYSGRTTESRSLSLYLPWDLFSDTAVGVDIKNNTAFSGTYAKLLIEYLDSFEANLPSMTAADLPIVVQTMRDMVVRCLSSSAGIVDGATPPSNSALMERARRFVQRNLNSPGLTPDSLARELGISRTRLYQLLEPSGGVLHYIQKRRLLSAHAALSNAANRQPILEIAAAVGFSSAAHFSRAFSKEFGYSPKEARNIVVPSYFAQAVPPVEAKGQPPSFANWLKSLGH
jgi:AraC-like DNA-binding protein